MIFQNPVRGGIYLVASGTRWYRSQRFGCTGFGWERPLGNCAHFHRGIDIARSDGACGQDVLAPQKGTVHFAGRLPDGAIVVELNHGGGWFSVVTHLQREFVSVGQSVAKGQKIGEHGKTGNATGCHVHFSIKSGCTPPYGSILGDTEGEWRDPWARLEQNITVHPAVSPDGINIRASASTTAAAFAQTRADRIRRVSDGKDLGPTAGQYGWGGTVIGGSYTVAGKTGTKWDVIELDGGNRYLATPLAVRSAS